MIHKYKIMYSKFDPKVISHAFPPNYQEVAEARMGPAVEAAGSDYGGEIGVDLGAPVPSKAVRNLTKDD
jgi:hypothetical protein